MFIRSLGVMAKYGNTFSKTEQHQMICIIPGQSDSGSFLWHNGLSKMHKLKIVPMFQPNLTSEDAFLSDPIRPNSQLLKSTMSPRQDVFKNFTSEKRIISCEANQSRACGIYDIFYGLLNYLQTLSLSELLRQKMRHNNDTTTSLITNIKQIL
uniref:Uncharacterized protein n=1 Tax=Glossina austeni TaxID=7395 RepID=A0A1A9UN81_GLOAU